MAISGDALDVILRVQGLRAFTRGMRTASTEVRNVGRAAKQTTAEQAAMGKGTGFLAMAGKASRWGAAGLAAMAVESYKLNVNFSRDMTQVQTMAGATSGEVAGMRKEILNLKDVAQTPDELAKGLYHIESIGLRGKEAMDALKAASQGAALGNSDLESTATALGSVLMVRMGGAARTASGAMAQLSAIAGAGNMHMRDLVYALGTNILPAAKVAGISLQNVGAAIALLVDEGMPASSAAAQLGTALHFLYSPTDKAKKALGSLGLSQADLVNQLHGKDGLMGALDLLNKRLTGFAGNNDAKKLDILGQILPGGRGRVLISLMNQIDRYGGKITKIARTSGQFDQNVAVMHQTASFRIHNAWNRINSALIQFSDVWQGPATDALVWFMDHGVVPLINALAGIPHAVRNVVKWYHALPEPIKIVVGAIGLFVAEIAVYQGVTKAWALANALVAASYGFLTGAIETTYLAFLIMMDNPIMLALAALIIIIALVVMHWKWFKNAGVNAFHWVVHAGQDAWHWIKKHWPLLLGVFLGPFGAMIALVITHFGQLKKIVKSVLHWIAHAWNSTVGGFSVKIPSWVPHFGGHHLTIPTIHVGKNAQGTQGWMGGLSVVGERGPELVNLPRGASVIPTGQSYFEPRRHLPNPAPSDGGGKPIVVEAHSHLYLDRHGKREIATAVNRFNADTRARA
jgi:TP901 family phage tail tape measure protein